MTKTTQTKQLQNRLLLLVAGGIFITALIVTLSLIIPVYQIEKEEQTANLVKSVETHAIAIEDYLNSVGLIAMQVGSRSFARDKLEQYQRSEISLKELQKVTTPILNDAMKLIPDIVGITRLDNQGFPVISIGDELPTHLAIIPNDDANSNYTETILLKHNLEEILLVSAKIVNRQQHRVGTDVIGFIVHENSILKQSLQGNAHAGHTHIGILKDNNLTQFSSADMGDHFSLTDGHDNLIESVLMKGASGETGIIDATLDHGENYLIFYTQIGNRPWGIATIVQTHQLYSSLQLWIVPLLGIVIFIAGISILLMVFLLRPLTGKILIRTDELELEIDKATTELQRTNRALHASSACSKALIHAQNEDELISDICRLVVNIGSYRMTWIGYKQNDDAKTVIPAAQFGIGQNYVNAANLSWSGDNKYGQGPCGTSIREGKPIIVRNVRTDPHIEPWRKDILKSGYASIIGLPLIYKNETFGTFVIYAADTKAFDNEEVELLSKLADDLAFGIMSLRIQADHQWAEQELADSEERWRSLTETTPDHIFTLNNRLRIEFVNTPLPDQNIEQLIGSEYLNLIQNPFKRREVKSKLEKALLNKGEELSFEIEHKTKAGDVIHYETRIAPRVVDKKTIGITLNTRNITNRKRNEARIQHLAFYDELTGLPNRRLLLDRLGHHINSARRHGNQGALLFLDLDHFKNINDSLGHATGDAILREVTKRLLQNVRADDSVARLGGDEFMVLLPDLKPDPDDASYEANLVAEKLRCSISTPYLIGGNQYYTSPSIGIAMFPFDNETAEDVLKHADNAMFRAKTAGRNSIRFYHPSMQKAADQRLTLEKDLRYALDQNQFQLFYQPLVDIDNKIVGTEALIRWLHPERGLVSPVDFIPVAEETGLILSIGEWVIQEAARQFSDWQTHSWCLQNGFFSVNISARQFHQPNFIGTLSKILDEYQINPEYFKLELTESLLIENIADSIAKMDTLHDLGVHIAIDDFGTGYSSLSYLKRLPIDQIKIDKSFVLDITEDSNDAAIVETIISIAKHMGLSVIAEGVETAEILEKLKSNNCELFQGYYFSRPLPKEEFFTLINTNNGIIPAQKGQQKTIIK